MENFGVEGQHDMKCVFMFRVVGTADWQQAVINNRIGDTICMQRVCALNVTNDPFLPNAETVSGARPAPLRGAEGSLPAQSSREMKLTSHTLDWRLAWEELYPYSPIRVRIGVPN